MTPGVRILPGMASKMRPCFVRLHAATLNRATTAEEMAALLTAADALPERHRLSEGAVYVSAQRRYLMLTGKAWKDTGRTTGDTTWTTSDHRSRIAADGTWTCSCGQAGTATDEATAVTAHAAHRASAA